jgi:hypothetical protein
VAEKIEVNLQEFPAFGPEKEAWKAEGRFYSAAELKQMAEEFKDLKIEPPRRRIYVVE